MWGSIIMAVLMTEVEGTGLGLAIRSIHKCVGVLQVDPKAQRQQRRNKDRVLNSLAHHSSVLAHLSTSRSSTSCLNRPKSSFATALLCPRGRGFQNSAETPDYDPRFKFYTDEWFKFKALIAWHVSDSSSHGSLPP